MGTPSWCVRPGKLESGKRRSGGGLAEGWKLNERGWAIRLARELHQEVRDGIGVNGEG